MLNKKIILTILLVLWMIVIFMFSNQDGIKSQSTSDKVTRNTINVVNDITNNDISKTKKEEIVKNVRFIIRKTAHFTLYFILGILVYLTLTSYGLTKRTIIYSIIFCFIYAISDEIHQLYVGGRSFKILDILIDTSGSSLSGLITNLIIKNKKVKYIKNN